VHNEGGDYGIFACLRMAFCFALSSFLLFSALLGWAFVLHSAA